MVNITTVNQCLCILAVFLLEKQLVRDTTSAAAHVGNKQTLICGFALANRNRQCRRAAADSNVVSSLCIYFNTQLLKWSSELIAGKIVV